MKNTEWSYIAGLIDGEGCISILKNYNDKCYVRIKIKMTDEKIIRWLHVRLGGTVVEENTSFYNSNARNGWKWNLNKQKEIVIFLKNIYPYLIVKLPQAKLAIDFIESKICSDEEVKEKFHLLNRRGNGLRILSKVI